MTALINVISAWSLRGREKLTKRRDWLRDKQIKDVEEIIPTLNSFLKEFSDVLQELDAIQGIENDGLKWQFSERAKHISDSVDDVSWIATSKEDLSKSLRKASKEMGEASTRLWDEEARRMSWFDFDAKRLTVWFEESDGVDASLSFLGQQFNKIHLEIHRASHNLDSFYYWLSREGGELTSEDVKKSQLLGASFKAAIEKKHDVNATAIVLQKELIDKFRPRKSIRRQVTRWLRFWTRRLSLHICAPKLLG